MLKRLLSLNNVFWLGFIICLLLFGFGTDLLPGFKIEYSLEGSKPEWLTTIGTLSAVIVAIWGSKIKSILSKPEMLLVSRKENIQNSKGITRLLFKNKGDSVATGVEVYVEKIFDNNSERLNFLPVPLRWTHDGRSKRDFYPNQYGYLDLVELDITYTHNEPKLVLYAGGGVSQYEKIRQGASRLDLLVFEGSGQVKKYELNLEWQSGSPGVSVVSFKEK